MNSKIQITLILVLALVLLVDCAAPKKQKNNKNKKDTKKGTKDTKSKLPKSDEPNEGDQSKKSGECKDADANCKSYLGQCDDKTYEELLKKHCGVTCGFCPPGKGAACKDMLDRCGEMKTKGFCGSKKHSVNEQRMFCVKTCDLCEK